MPKLNEKNLDEHIQEIIIRQLLYSITMLESPKQTAAFFSDFLTDSETIMLSKRLAIAVLLLRGHSQTLITKMLSVSYSATGAVASWLKNADSATALVLNTISQNDDWKELVYNYKLVNKPSRSTIKAQSSASQIDTHPEFSPADLSSALQSGDFEALDGPELNLDEVPSAEQPSPATKSPSMADLLEEV